MHDFVWNDNIAENFRQNAIAAMQGTTCDMIEVAEKFIIEATEKEERANQLQRQMPVMRWVERLIPNDGTNDEHSQQTEWVQVVDTNATARRQAEIDLLREKAKGLREGAKKLNWVAEELKRKIASLNAMFNQMHENKNNTENFYTNEARELHAMIEDYIRRMGELRDSFGNKFTTAADGTVYFGSTSSSVVTQVMGQAETPGDRIAILATALNLGWKELVVNSSALRPEMWEDIEDLFSRERGTNPNRHLTDTHLRHLAWLFGDLEYPPDLERFLNAIAVPVPTEFTITSQGGAFTNPNGIIPYTVCPEILRDLRRHLDARILTNFFEQMTLPTTDTRFNELDDIIALAMRNSVLLEMARQVAYDSQGRGNNHNPHPSMPNPYWFLQGVLSCQGNGPFSITTDAFVNGGIVLTVGQGELHRDGQPPNDFGSMWLLPTEGLRGSNPIYIRPVLEPLGSATVVTNLAAQNFNVQNQFDVLASLLANGGDLALAIATLNASNTTALAMSLATFARDMYLDANSANAVLSDFAQVMDAVALGHYLNNFQMRTIIVEESERGRNAPIIWDVFPWPTVYTFPAVDAFNDAASIFTATHPHVQVPQLTYLQFLHDPLAAAVIFQGNNLCICGMCGNRRQNPNVARGCRDAQGRFMGNFGTFNNANMINREFLVLFPPS